MNQIASQSARSMLDNVCRIVRHAELRTVDDRQPHPIPYRSWYTHGGPTDQLRLRLRRSSPSCPNGGLQWSSRYSSVVLTHKSCDYCLSWVLPYRLAISISRGRRYRADSLRKLQGAIIPMLAR